MWKRCSAVLGALCALGRCYSFTLLFLKCLLSTYYCKALSGFWEHEHSSERSRSGSCFLSSYTVVVTTVVITTVVMILERGLDIVCQWVGEAEPASFQSECVRMSLSGEVGVQRSSLHVWWCRLGGEEWRAEQPRAWSYKPGAEIQKSLKIKSEDMNWDRAAVWGLTNMAGIGKGSCMVEELWPSWRSWETWLRSEVTADLIPGKARLADVPERTVSWGEWGAPQAA